MTRDRIGYGNPPKATRFKLGVSGNPRGRPKGGTNLATDLAEELREKVTIRSDGQTQRVSKQPALIKALMKKAPQGDVRSSAAVLSLYAKVITEPVANDEPVSDDERKILRRFLPQLLKSLE